MTIGEVFVFSALLLQMQTAPGEIRGTVMADRDGRRAALPYAMVEVRSAEGVRWVMSDGAGRYLAVGVAADSPLRLRAVHLGHEDARLEVTVPSGSRVTVDLVLTPKPIDLPPVLVNAGSMLLPDLEGDRSPPAQARARGEVALRALEATPGLAESGVGEAASRLPGNEPSDPTDVLFMRGSTADMKLVLLDGAPVYTPFHMGGLLRSFDAEVLGSATHHVGGAPARYDGGLSYILDLKTRRPGRARTRWVGGVDLMSARTAFESPIGERAGILLSTRTLHGLQSRLAGGRGSPYGYLDGLAKAEVDLADGHRLSLLGFGNGESVRLGLPTESTMEAAFPGGPLGRRPESASWGNGLLSLSYAGEWWGTAWEVRGSTTQYRADLPLPLRSDSSANAPPATNSWEALLASGETRRSLAGLDGVRFLGSAALRFGGTVDFSEMRLGARRLTSASPDSVVAYERTARATVAGAYLDLQRPLSNEVHLRTGVRWDSYGTLGSRGGLRLGLLWNLTENALLTVAGGRYHQLVRTSDADAQLALGDGSTTGTGGPTTQVENLPLLSVGSADHLVLSLDQQLTPELRLTTEGYFKRFSGMDGLGREQLNASGLDLRVLRSGERVTGWLGYSLSWFWDSPDPLGRAEEFTGRQLLSLGLQGRLAQRWGLDFALAYSDGLPLTSIPFARGSADFAAEQTAPPTVSSASRSLSARDSGTFFRVDLEGFADLEAEWGSRTIRLRPYLRVLNALDRRDALFYYFEPWRDPELRPLAELSVIPVLGLEWRF